MIRLLLPRHSWLTAIFLLVAVGSSGIATLQAATVREVFKFTASVPTRNEGLGRAVAISGDRALVGGYGFLLPGAAYVFDLSTGHQLNELRGSDTARFDLFGGAADLDGQLAVVGAPGRGAAYLFDIATGQELFKLTSSDGELNEQFGESVAVSGNRVLVGAPFQNDRRGAVYVFDALSGQQLAKLVAAGEDAYNVREFGSSVAIDGNLAVIGVGALEAGPAAYTFDLQTGQQLRKLAPSDRPGGFMSVVSISGPMVIMGDPGSRQSGLTNSGAAYVFDALSGRELFKFTAPNPAAFDYFGGFVDISNHFAVVGAINADLPRGVDAGAAYLFDLTTSQQVAMFTASDPAANAWFGTVGISGNRIIVGAPSQNGLGPGAAYLFVIVPEPSASCTALLLVVIVVLRSSRWRKLLTARR